MMYPEPEWKTRMHQPVSNAEYAILEELSKRGLNRGLMTQNPICLLQCVPDFMWANLKIAVFLDGQVHNKPSRQAKDEEITRRLQDRGWRVLRISYTAPLSKRRKVEVMEEIESFLRTSEHFKETPK